MARSRSGSNPRFFETPDAFRGWLMAYADTETELIVGYYKVGSGRPSLTWPESVDEALCFGWIDGVRRSVDEQAYSIRFTPRRPGSIWSAVNIARAEALIAEGRMRPAGLAAFQRRIERASRVYSYEQKDNPSLPPEDLEQFQAHPSAWEFFASTPPSYRRNLVHWLLSARQPATRARRLARLIDACERKTRLI